MKILGKIDIKGFIKKASKGDKGAKIALSIVVAPAKNPIKAPAFGPITIEVTIVGIKIKNAIVAEAVGTAVSATKTIVKASITPKKVSLRVSEKILFILLPPCSRSLLDTRQIIYIIAYD